MAGTDAEAEASDHNESSQILFATDTGLTARVGVVVRNVAGVADTGLTVRVVVEGGIVASGSRGNFRRC